MSQLLQKFQGFFSLKIVCSFIDLLILINFSEYNAVVWWYFRFLKHSDRYHFFSIGIWSNLQIFFINLYHLYVRKTICERYFIVNWAFLKIIFSNAKKNYIQKIHGPIVLHVWIKKSNVNMCDTWLHWFFGSEKCFFQVLLLFTFLHIFPGPWKLRMPWSTFQ